MHISNKHKISKDSQPMAPSAVLARDVDTARSVYKSEA